MADYSSKKFQIFKLTDRIYKLKPYAGVELDVEDLREARKVYLEFSGGKGFAILLDGENEFSTSPEARVLMASKEHSELRIAAAFYTASLPNKLIGNFFLRVNKPITPAKMFNDEESAFDWLQEQMKGI